MGIFSAIMDKIFHHPAAQSAAPQASTASAPTPTATSASPAPATAPAQPQPAQSPQPAQASQPAPVDVEAVLAKMAQDKGGGGNWRSSIVDLLKLLDLDSGLPARTELGKELGVRAGADGSAEQNIALHRAVMQKLAENGGHVPDSLRHAA